MHSSAASKGTRGTCSPPSAVAVVTPAGHLASSFSDSGRFMAARPQTYSTHRRIFPLYHYALVILIANVIVRVTEVARAPNWSNGWDLVVSVALACAILAARSMALVVQNRVIRLEMRLRLAQVLPPELRDRIGGLTLRQLVSLRFASDAELPELVQRCLAGDLARSDEIKKSIRDWQPDFLRA